MRTHTSQESGGIQFRGINFHCWFHSICIFRIFSLLLIRDILAWMNQQRSDESEDLLGRIGRETRRDVSYLRVRLARLATLLLYYTNKHVHRHARARAHAKGTKLDLRTKLDPRRLSPFFPGTRRVAEPTPVVVLNIRLSRALIV